MSESPSVLIIGAGAAGLAAGRALRDAGCDALIVEARERIGGRIQTDYEFADFPVELGAEFIHGERAVTHSLVRQAGLNTLPVVRMDNLWWAEAGRKAVPRAQLQPSLQSQIEKLLADYHHLPDVHMSQDVSLAEYLQGKPLPPTPSPYTERGSNSRLEMAAILLAQTCCANLDSLSCYDLIREMRDDHAGYEEARIQEGYGSLLAWYSRDLAIRLKTAVDEIHWNADGVTALVGETTFPARACIITVPVSILQQQRIRFDPPLSEGKRWAIDALRTEPATKLIYRFREPRWRSDLTFMAHNGLAARWWTPGYGRKDAAVMCAFITADRAREIDAMTEAQALETGLQELSVLLDVHVETLRAEVVSSRRISWAADPYALGGYAHVPPGAAEARPLLAQPEGDVLFFAGEATAYDTNPQTVHGAIESGWRAARECLVSIS